MEHADALALARTATGDGAVWGLASDDLNATVVRLGPGGRIGAHVNGALDVLVVGLAGAGSIDVDGVTLPVGQGSVLLVPRGARRSLAAGDDTPLVYVTVHRRRGGLEIGSAPPGQQEPPDGGVREPHRGGHRRG